VPCIVYKQSYVYCKQLSCVANSHIRTKLGYPEKRGVPQGTVVCPIIFTLQITRVVNHNLKYGLIDVDENENLASKYFFRPPNLGNIALPYTLGQGRCDFPYNIKNF
jgi:hypothetical protein